MYLAVFACICFGVGKVVFCAKYYHARTLPVLRLRTRSILPSIFLSPHYLTKHKTKGSQFRISALERTEIECQRCLEQQKTIRNMKYKLLEYTNRSEAPMSTRLNCDLDAEVFPCVCAHVRV